MELIKTNDYLLLIDEEAVIKEHDYVLHGNIVCAIVGGKDWRIPKGLMIFNHIKLYYQTICKDNYKVIAYYPLSKEAKELDLPLLPNPFKAENKEIQIDKLAKEYINKEYSSYGVKSALIDIFKEGYKTTQVKQFTIEDVRKAFEYYAFATISNQPYNKEELDDEFNKFITKLYYKQLPKEFIPCTEVISNEIVKCIDNSGVPGTFTIDQEYENVSKTSGVEIRHKGNWVFPTYNRFVVVKSREVGLVTVLNSKGKAELMGTYKY